MTFGKKQKAQRVSKKIEETILARVQRVLSALDELSAAVAATRFTQADFPEATEFGLDVLHWQKVCDDKMAQAFGPEVFKFFTDYETARQRDIAAKHSVWNRQRP